MDELWASPAAGVVRAKLAALASWADDLAADAEAIARVGGWETAAVAEFQIEMANLVAALRGLRERALDLRADVRAQSPWPVVGGYPGFGLAGAGA